MIFRDQKEYETAYRKLVAMKWLGLLSAAVAILALTVWLPFWHALFIAALLGLTFSGGYAAFALSELCELVEVSNTVREAHLLVDKAIKLMEADRHE